MKIRYRINVGRSCWGPLNLSQAAEAALPGRTYPASWDDVVEYQIVVLVPALREALSR